MRRSGVTIMFFALLGMHQIKKFFSGLRIVSKNSQHSGSDSFAVDFLDTSHHHTHMSESKNKICVPTSSNGQLTLPRRRRQLQPVGQLWWQQPQFVSSAVPALGVFWSRFRQSLPVYWDRESCHTEDIRSRLFRKKVPSGVHTLKTFRCL